MPRATTQPSSPGDSLGRSPGAATIANAAMAVFSKKGFSAASIRDIAKRARMSPANLYHHFGSKQDLLFYLMDSSMDYLLERSEQVMADAGEDPGARLRALVVEHARLHAEDNIGAQISAREIRHLEAPQRRVLVEKMRRQQRKFDEVVDAGVAAGAFTTPFPGEAALAIASMCTAVASWYSPKGPLRPGEVGEHYGELALAMVMTTSPPSGRRSR